MRTFLLLGPALCALCSLSPASTDVYPKNTHIDVLHYAFTLVLVDDTDEIQGEARIDVRFLAEGLDSLRLDLGQEMRVTGATCAGEDVAFQHTGDVLRIALGDTSRALERRQLTVRYQGTPASGLVIGPNKHGDRTFFSDNWPNKARQWLPTVDHPYDKATCEFSVSAPDHYQVISNGLLLEETDLPDGMRRTHWKQSVPIATWLYALGVARFAVQYVGTFEGKSIQTWVYPQDRDAGFHDFAVPTKAVLEFFSDRIGPFSYEKLANVQSNSVGGGMEAATAIFYGDDSVTGQRTERWRNVVIHEIAHQWFGNSVTEYDWDDVWLSEGFATYFTLLFIEHAYGRDEFLRGLERSRARVQSFHEKDPDYRIVHEDLADMKQVTSSQTYQKGAWILHMLRGVVGDDAFWLGIRAYYREYRDGSASTDDFRRAMESASGRDLRAFFQQWLYRGGELQCEGGWRHDPDRGTVQIELSQVQGDGMAFAMPLTVRLDFEDAESRVERLEIDGLQETFEFNVEHEPTRVLLDPDTFVLMRAEFGRLGPAGFPASDHLVLEVEGWRVHVDQRLTTGDGARVGDKALRILSDKLLAIRSTLPATRVAQLALIPIWIDLDHPLRTMQYHPAAGWLRDHGYDVRMEDSVHIPRAQGLIDLHESNAQPWVVLHELAHAYHDRVLGFDHPGLQGAFERASRDGIYESVLHVGGGTKRHYALTDHKEFFAEMTEAFFGTNDFFPFVRAELMEHDPQTLELLETIWGE